MLRNRVLTALVLIPLVTAGVLLAPYEILAASFGIVVLVGARETARLSGVRSPLVQWILAAAVGALLVGAGVVATPVLERWLIFAGAAFWVLAGVFLFTWHRTLTRVEQLRPWVMLLGALQLLIAWLAVTALHRSGPQGPALLLFLLVLIWTADSAAYFAGRAWGRRKLSPELSPGKTWEGVAGGMLGALLAALVLWQLGLTQLSFHELVGLCVVTAFLSIAGDLWESLLKRQVGLKDSGAVLPGHGGMLDRIDSLIAASPVFVGGLYLLEGGL